MTDTTPTAPQAAAPPSSTREPASPRRWPKTLLKLGVSVGLLVFLFTQLDLDLRAAFSRYGSAHVGLLAAGLALMLAQGLISSIKWRTILRADGCDLPLLYLWKTYLIGMFVSLMLPTSFGGDVYRVYALRRAEAGLSRGTSSVLFDRLTGLAALVSIAMIGAVVLTDSQFVWLIVLSYGTLVVAGLVLTGNRAVAWMQQWDHKLLRFPVKVLTSFNTYRRDKSRMMIVIGISLLFQANIVVISKVFCAAIGIDVAFWQLLLVVPLAYLTEALPISINGLGVRESAFVFLFTLIGRTPEEGLALAVIVVLFRYGKGLIGGGLLTWDWLRSDVAAPPPAAEPGRSAAG